MQPAQLIAFLSLLVASCYAQSNGELRLLRDGATSYSYTSGRLQIYLDGQWGNICDTGFGLTEAVVACQQLTYNTALSFGNSQSDIFGTDNLTALLDNVDCPNNDSLHILQCEYTTSPSCSRENYASITCSAEFIWDDAHYSQVRLLDGRYPSEGRLEYNSFGDWYTVCNDLFGSDPAGTACRQLGYTDLLAYDQLDLPGEDIGILHEYYCCYEVEDCFGDCGCPDDDNFDDDGGIDHGGIDHGGDIDGVDDFTRIFETCDHDEDVTIQCTFIVANKDLAGTRNQCDSTLTTIILASVFGTLFGIIGLVVIGGFVFVFVKFMFCDH